MSEISLFPDNASFVDQDPESAGFYALELPDQLRWLKPRAVCRCRLNAAMTYTSPCLVVRAHTRAADWGPYLMASIDGRRIGVKHIARYGTYYFPFPAEFLTRGRRDSVEVGIEIVAGPETVREDARGIALALSEVRIIEPEVEDFPERQEFLPQRKLFEIGPGGPVANILAAHHFQPTDRILDLGAGMGWTTVLLAGFSGASAWGIDLYDYSHVGRLSFKTVLLERFERHRAALRPISSLSALADRKALEETVRRCEFATVDAQAMPWRDEYFDFVFSLNVMEHVGNPARVLQEVRRVLRPGGRALMQFSPLYYSDTGSHLPATLGFNRPWVQLLLSRDEIKKAILAEGGVPYEVDNILDSLNGWTPSQFREMFEQSGLTQLEHTVQRGFILPGAGESEEYHQLRERYSEEDLSTFGLIWHLEKPRVPVD